MKQVIKFIIESSRRWRLRSSQKKKKDTSAYFDLRTSGCVSTYDPLLTPKENDDAHDALVLAQIEFKRLYRERIYAQLKKIRLVRGKPDALADRIIEQFLTFNSLRFVLNRLAHDLDFSFALQRVDLKQLIARIKNARTLASLLKLSSIEDPPSTNLAVNQFLTTVLFLNAA